MSAGGIHLSFSSDTAHLLEFALADVDPSDEEEGFHASLLPAPHNHTDTTTLSTDKPERSTSEIAGFALIVMPLV